MISGNNKTAYGVKFIKDSVNFIVYRRKGVILSAVTINFPESGVGLLSGVGPQQQLNALRNLP